MTNQKRLYTDDWQTDYQWPRVPDCYTNEPADWTNQSIDEPDGLFRPD